MAEPINIGGILYEEAGNGQLRVVGYADAPPSTVVPPSPLKVAKEQRQEAHQASVDARGERREDRAQTTAEVANRLKEQEIILAKQKEQREGNTAKDIAGWRSNLQNIGLLERRIADLRQQYAEHFKGKGPIRSTAESYAPGKFAPQYQVFDVTADSMLADMAKAKGLTAQQFNTPAEQRMFFEPLVPHRGDPDEVIEKKLDNLEDMIRTGRKTTEMQLGLAHQKADNEVPGQPNGADTKPDVPTDPNPFNDPSNLGGPGTSGAQGQSRFEYDPKASSQIDAMMNAGASYAMVNEALKKRNLPAITAGSYAAAKKWMKANPGKAYFGSDIHREVPLTVGQKFSGSPLGSFLAHASDMGTAGGVSGVSGEKGRGALAAMGAMNSNASMAGDLAGGVLGAGTLEAGVAAKAPASLARYAPRIADALYGGLTGFNQAEEGQGVEGAVGGSVAGLGGGILGNRLASGAGKVVRGVANPAVQRLRAAGIPLTVGEVLGGGAKKAQDALTSLPLIGGRIANRYNEGRRALNETAFNEAGQTVGQPIDAVGQEGIDLLNTAKNQAYSDALDPVMLDIRTPQFTGDRANIENFIQTRIRPVDGAQDAAMEALAGRIDAPVAQTGGIMAGRDFQEAYRGLARTGRERANRDYGYETGQAMRQTQDALATALEEQNPGAYEGFLNANSANRHLNILADAVNAAKSQVSDEGEMLFTPAQLGTAATNNAKTFTGKIAAASGDRPFNQLATDAQQVMSSKVPDSGTPARMLMSALATGGLASGGAAGGYGLGGETGAGVGGLGTILALAAGGSRPAQRLMVNLLTRRPQAAGSVADLIERNARIGGWTGAGVLTPLTVGP